MDLAACTLVELTSEYQAVELGIYAFYPRRKHVPAKVRAWLDFLGERVGDAGRFS